MLQGWWGQLRRGGDDEDDRTGATMLLYYEWLAEGTIDVHRKGMRSGFVGLSVWKRWRTRVKLETIV